MLFPRPTPVSPPEPRARRESELPDTRPLRIGKRIGKTSEYRFIPIAAVVRHNQRCESRYRQAESSAFTASPAHTGDKHHAENDDDQRSRRGRAGLHSDQNARHARYQKAAAEHLLQNSESNDAGD